MTRALRRFVAKLGIAALLFMQFAVAAYACPGVADSAGSPMVMVMTMDDAAEAMPQGDCAMADPSAPNLCAQHCQQDSQAGGQASPPLVFAVDLPLLAVLPVVAVAAPLAPAVSPEFLAQATAPPPFIRFGAFRS